MAQGTKYPTTCNPVTSSPTRLDVTQRQSKFLLNENILNENSARAVNLTVTHSAMSSPPNESKTLDTFLGMEEAVDYGSDTSVQGDTGTMSDTSSPMPEALPPITQASPSGHYDVNTPQAQHPMLGSDENIITNLLDERQELVVQQQDRAQRYAHIRATLQHQSDYVFTPPSVEERIRQTNGQTLATWVIGRAATSPEEVATCQTLRERYLEPFLTTQGQYKARLEMQARGAPVPPIKGIPILLFAGESTHEEDNAFVR